MKNSDKMKTPLMNLYAIIDDVAGTFYPPFISQNNGTAERSFFQMLTNEETGMSRNPQDYRLFFLGDFDPDDGQIQPLSSPEHVASGNAVLAARNPSKEFLNVDK